MYIYLTQLFLIQSRPSYQYFENPFSVQPYDSLIQYSEQTGDHLREFTTTEHRWERTVRVRSYSRNLRGVQAVYQVNK